MKAPAQKNLRRVLFALVALVVIGLLAWSELRTDGLGEGFASGSDELARGAAEALGDVVRGVAAGKKAVISGFHDVTGDPARNEELAKQRALRVRDALTALGIGEDKLDLRKPAVTTADGSNAEARRVEVTLE